MAKQKKEHKKLLNKKLAKVFLAVFVIAVFALVGVCAAFSYQYRNKVLPKTYFSSGQLIEGKSLAQLQTDFDKTAQESKGQKVKAVKGDKSWEMSLDDFGWEMDPNVTANNIYSYGHGPSIFKNALAMLGSLIFKRTFNPEVKFNEKTAEDWLGKINDEIGTPKQEGNVQVKSGKAKVLEPTAGKTVDTVAAEKSLMDRFLLKSSGQINIEIIDDNPVVTKAEAEALQAKAISLSASDIKLIGPSQTVTLSSDTIGSMIEIKKQTKKSFLSKQVAFGDAYVSFSADKIRSFLEKNSDQLNVVPKDAKFTIVNGQVTITSASSTGKGIIVDDSVNKIINVLEAGQEKSITLPFKGQQASIAAQEASDIAQYGLKELIGTATTSFGKSPSNRIHNIQNGVQYISGALIKPGEEFSTLNRLGSIDASTGYLPELVIKEDSTVPEFGGGLCQVSTTLFRAAMNSGLTITERQNHSYRVPYYEPPVGMDATIYSPAPDFKFVNNTDHYILIQGRVEGTNVTFDIYGTKDGRQVNISTPVVYDITPPPATIYIDDPSLAPGELKRLDTAHSGAKATFTYTVTKDGKVINKQVFNSSYVAWAAKYARGPGSPDNSSQPAATPQPTPSVQAADSPTPAP
jgi:vancomycin resistance protein YoaR